MEDIRKLLDEGVSQREIARRVGIPYSSLRNRLVKNGSLKDTRGVVSSICRQCKKEILFPKKRDFCNNKCQGLHSKAKSEEKIEEWKAGRLSGHTGKAFKIKSFVKEWLISLYGEKCSLCGWAERNPSTGNIPIEVDHIDGNAENTAPNNLRLLCLNCHSLTPTFRGLNKKSNRTHWQDKYYRGVA